MRRATNLLCACFGAIAVSIVWAAWFHYDQGMVATIMIGGALTIFYTVFIEEKP